MPAPTRDEELEDIKDRLRGDVVQGSNYGIQNGNGASKIVWWILGGLMAIQVALAAAAIQFVGGTLYNMNARLAVVEARLSECSK